MFWRIYFSNAWKYTARRALARIEVGCIAQAEGMPAFFVRDNGAGFEMKDASRLFQPFRRLHRQHEFAGTGEGLAIVQRIFQRHGGWVWAEAAVEEGAILYLTLNS